MRLMALALGAGLLVGVSGCGDERAAENGRPATAATEAPAAGAATATATIATAATSPMPAPTWLVGPRMLTPRAEMSAAVLGGRIYIGGGLDRQGNNLAEFEVYDPAAQMWRALTPLPLPLDHFAMAALGGRVYVSGGSTNFRARNQTLSAALFVYDPATDGWTRLADMPLRRWAHAMVAADGRLYVLGGWGDESRVTLAYDPATDRWERRAPMAVEREHLGAVAHDGRVYAVGGRWMTANSGRAEVYDPAADAWQPLAALPTPRGGIGVALLGGGIHVLGGEGFNPPRTFGEHEVYSIAAGRWQPAAPMQAPRHGIAAVTLEGKLYAIGGLRQGVGTITDLVEIFDPSEPRGG